MLARDVTGWRYAISSGNKSVGPWTELDGVFRDNKICSLKSQGKLVVVPVFSPGGGSAAEGFPNL